MYLNTVIPHVAFCFKFMFEKLFYAYKAFSLQENRHNNKLVIAVFFTYCNKIF